MKILFCTYGSAGDILPYMAVAESLLAVGAEPEFLTDRWLGLYPRSAGFISNVVGGTSERRVLNDAELFSVTFDGLYSRRKLFSNYIFPFLNDHYGAVRDRIRAIAPDLIVTSPLALWGALAAVELGIPHVGIHLYPDLLNLLDRPTRRRSWRFALPLARWIEDFEDRIGSSPSQVPSVSWGSNGTPLLLAHDPAIVGRSAANATCVGFPYWDKALEGTNAETADAVAFLSQSKDPNVIVCLGSFIGLREPGFWIDMFEQFRNFDAKAVFVGVPDQIRKELRGRNIRAFGYLQMSRITPLAHVVIHHGGIGTMYGVLGSGVPAVVVPRAFDQPFNAEALARAGGGIRMTSMLASDIAGTAMSLANDTEAQSRTRRLSTSLVSPAEACSNIVDELVRAGGSGLP